MVLVYGSTCIVRRFYGKSLWESIRNFIATLRREDRACCSSYNAGDARTFMEKANENHEEREEKMWAMIGDFKAMLRRENRVVCLNYNAGCKKFCWSQQKLNIMLFDPNSRGKNKHATLYRFICNLEWRQTFDSFKLHHLTRICWDHCPILVNIDMTANDYNFLNSVGLISTWGVI